MGMLSFLDKEIERFIIRDLDEFVTKEMTARYEAEFKAHKFNPIHQIAKFNKKRLLNITLDKIKKDLENGDTFTFEDWKDNKKHYGLLKKEGDKVILIIFEKKIY